MLTLFAISCGRIVTIHMLLVFLRGKWKGRGGNDSLLRMMNEGWMACSFTMSEARRSERLHDFRFCYYTFFTASVDEMSGPDFDSSLVTSHIYCSTSITNGQNR